MKLTVPPQSLVLDYDTLDPIERRNLKLACAGGERAEVWPGAFGSYFISHIEYGGSALRVHLERTKVQ